MVNALDRSALLLASVELMWQVVCSQRFDATHLGGAPDHRSSTEADCSALWCTSGDTDADGMLAIFWGAMLHRRLVGICGLSGGTSRKRVEATALMSPALTRRPLKTPGLKI